MTVKCKQSLSCEYSSRRLVNEDSKSENARDLHERACDFTPTLIMAYAA